MRIILNAQVQGTAVRNLNLVHLKHPAGEMCGVQAQSDYLRLECDTVLPEHSPPQYSDLMVEAARPSVMYLDTPRHIPEHKNIPGRRHNRLKFHSYKCFFLFTGKKTARSIVYFQYSVFPSTVYVKDKMSFLTVT